MRILKETAILKHVKDVTPILDIDPDNTDAYLAELNRRAFVSHYDESQRDAVLGWLN